MSVPTPDNELVDHLRDQLQAQPWYARFSNTVTSAVGAVGLIVWLLVANGVEIPGQWETGIGSGIALLTVLGVLKTKNGITPSTVGQVEQYVGQHRR
ncbi:membrane protein [Gordonia phage BaxterFox]|uniref:Membrane protein n=1 Tax=Gordonia phage BaxterFox TaxID=1821549 RepID=A0A142KCJ8_9CAUD|nr:holin [Gordonia phage BaxterFox]AMS03831.1 membrane protein [Gordonia phage BaxterFox]